MPQFSQVSTALRVPADNFSALTAGESLVTISRSFIREGQQFILVESEFSSDSEESTIAYWASCVSSQVIAEHYDVAYLSKMTHLSKDQVQKKLDENATFLAFLRVYRIPIKTQQLLQFNRQFAALATPIAVVDEFPLISNPAFGKKKTQIQDCTPSEHPELEALQSTIAHYAHTNPIAKDLDHDLSIFLGWVDSQTSRMIDRKPEWINAITSYGYRADETVDNKKSNYQAGTDFEIIIRQSLEFLGFKVDEAHQGGAGGIDIFCSRPYSLVGECKSGKSIPDNTVEQLDRIAKRHLKENYEVAHRFIIGPGQPTPNLIESAKISRIAIMKPETLQKLVEFHHRHPISLTELRDKCLVGGQVDDNVEGFLNESTLQLRLRSHVVTTLRKYLEDKDLKEIGFERFSGVFDTSNPSQVLKDRELHDILIELSSPLTGYLGRTKGDNWKADRFYFLRDLIV
jgi:hypothetical protein